MENKIEWIKLEPSESVRLLMIQLLVLERAGYKFNPNTTMVDILRDVKKEFRRQKLDRINKICENEKG